MQDDKLTLQQVLQDAIKALTGEDVKVYASGRTDAGVHAYKQVVHFDTASHIKAEKFAFALNPILPKDFKVVKSYKVADDFNARFDVKKKTYVYKFYVSRVELPFCDEREYQVAFPFNFELAKKCANLFVRTFDFTPFCKVGGEEKDRVRTIYSCKLISVGDEHFEIEVCGNGFLHNMVRIIAGTIIDVGIGKIKIEDLQKGFENNNITRAQTGRTLPPYALYLKNVEY